MRSKPNLGEYFILPNPNLRSYFKRSEAGNSKDFRPPFFKGLSRPQVLSMWEKELEKLNVKSKYPQLYAFEEDMKKNVGPLSIQKPLLEVLDTVEEYFTDVTMESEPISESAIQQTIRFFKRASGIRFRSRGSTVSNMKLSTNSGNPNFTKRSNVAKAALYTKVFKRNGVWNVNTPWGCFKLGAVKGWRGQEHGLSYDDVKQRVIWMMSFYLNAEELQFYQPAVEAMQATGLIPAYLSMDYVDETITKLFSTKSSGDVVVVTDFKRFDQHFNHHMQEAAKEIEKSLISSDSYIWMRDIYPAKFNIPIICNEEIMYSGPHGMGSGSGGTNFDECMAHKALQFEAALSHGHRLNQYSMAYGDDGILTYPGITVEDVIQTYSKHGQVMNPDKQYASVDDCVFLRRWHGTSYVKNGIMVGVYSTFRALGRLLGQERYYDRRKWNEKMVTLRALSIIENCKWSPYFHEFIDFVMKYDKLRLGLAVTGFFDHLEELAKEAMDYFTDFLGYTKSQMKKENSPTGIMDWEVVKYLRSLER